MGMGACQQHVVAYDGSDPVNEFGIPGGGELIAQPPSPKLRKNRAPLVLACRKLKNQLDRCSGLRRYGASGGRHSHQLRPAQKRSEAANTLRTSIMYLSRRSLSIFVHSRLSRGAASTSRGSGTTCSRCQTLYRSAQAKHPAGGEEPHRMVVKNVSTYSSATCSSTRSAQRQHGPVVAK